MCASNKHNLSELKFVQLFRTKDVYSNSITEELLEIDRVCFGDFSEKDTGDVEYWNKIIPYFFTTASYFGDKIIGYADFHKFSDDGVKMLEKGIIREGEMLEHIDTGNSREINIYVGCVAVLPDFRGVGVALKLFQNNFDFIKESGYVIKGAYATIWSKDGEKFFENQNPIVIGYDELKHKIIKFKIKQ